MTDKKLNAKVLSIKNEFNGFLKINRYEIETEKHEGGSQVVTRFVMERGHAVGVLGYDPKRDEAVLINEMRPGVLAAGDYPYTDNVVAGGIGKGETALQAAVREMLEEANMVLKDPVLVHPGAYVSSGGTSEKIAIVVGIVDTTGKAGGINGLASESENIKTVILPYPEFMRRIREGEIADLKTMVAAYWLAENRDRLRAQYAADAKPAANNAPKP